MSIPSMTLGPATVYFGDKNGKYPDGNQVVVQGREATAVFDTPLSANRIGERLQAADLVVLGHVHEDHVCGLHLLRHLPLHAPAADVAAVRSLDGLMAHYGYAPEVQPGMREHVVADFHYVERPDAVGYADGATWDLGGVTVRAVHMPGHTGGHSVLLVEPDGIAFLGDIDLSGFGPYYGDGCSSLADFRETLRRVPELPASVWITSHHKGVVTERTEMLGLLERFAGRIEARHEAIRTALAEQPMTLEELVARRFLYPPGYHALFVEDAERKTIREHLDALLAEGRIVEEGPRYRAA